MDSRLPCILVALTLLVAPVSAQLNNKASSELGRPSWLVPKDSACSGGTIADDGSFENGYRIALVSSSTFVQRVTPVAYPALLNQICVCWSAAESGDVAPVTLVAYDTSGAGGQPGVLLGSVAATWSSSTAFTSVFTGQACGQLGIVLSSGSLYVGGQWSDASAPYTLFECGDESGSTPLATMYQSGNGGTSWSAVTASHTNAHALGARAVFGAATGCIPNSKTLCLNNGRFRVTATYDTGSQHGDAQEVKLTSDTGYLWFFDSTNVEAVVKIINACSFNNRYWVYAGGLTDQGVVLTVTDTMNGSSKQYTNPRGTKWVTITDSNALATCP